VFFLDFGSFLYHCFSVFDGVCRVNFSAKLKWSPVSVHKRCFARAIFGIRDLSALDC